MLARDNPFAVGKFDTLDYQFPEGDDLERLLDRLEGVSMRGAIVGDEGRGKTTLLDSMRKDLSDRGFEVIRYALKAGDRRIPDPLAAAVRGGDSRTVLLLDGAEQLSRLSWWKLKRATSRLGGFVITSHKPGLLPTVLECSSSAELLADLLDQLAPNRPEHFPSAEKLLERHDGNIRLAMFEAYDFYAEIEAGG